MPRQRPSESQTSGGAEQTETGVVGREPAERIDWLLKGRVDWLLCGRIDWLLFGRIDWLLFGRIDWLLFGRIDWLLIGRIDLPSHKFIVQSAGGCCSSV